MFFALAALIGTIVPWAFFGSFIAFEGFKPWLFITSLFVTAPAGGFVADLLISITIFWVWSFIDARRNGVGLWWLTLPAASCVGLSLALPLYLLLRETAGGRSTAGE